MSSEKNKEPDLAEAAEQVSEAAEKLKKASDLAHKASVGASEAAGTIQQIAENTAEQRDDDTRSGSGDYQSQPQSFGESPDPPSSPSLPGDPSTTRPDY